MGEASASASLGSVAPATWGKYAPLGRLGSGGMADVFLALARGPQRVDKLVVIKRLRDPENEDLIQMFLDEARLAARLNHPNIVHTYEVAEANGEYFIAMEYLEGQPLSEVLKQLDAHFIELSEPLLVHIAVQALKGLHYAHEFCDFDGTPINLVHRDVSPHNLFVTYNGEVKLLDFGIAKAALNATRTESGVLKGKVRYMAPEQASTSDVDRRADIYSFGVVLWEALARRPLFTGDAMAILNRPTQTPIPSLRSLRPMVSPELEAIVLKTLRPEREDRYATAEEVRLHLEHFQRSNGEGATDEELARLMNHVFEAPRDRLRARIKEQIAEIASGENRPSGRDLPLLHASTREPPSSLPPLTAGWRAALRRTRWPVGLSVAAALATAVAWMSVHDRAPEAPAAVTSDRRPITPAHLRLETTPPAAFVDWNGTRFGPTPTDIAIDPGRQTLLVTRDGHESTVLTIDATPGEEITRAVTLRPKSESAPPALATSAQPLTPRVDPRAHAATSSAPHASASAADSLSPSPTARPHIRMIDRGGSP
jgi:serine/threonine protein kinase